MEEKSGYRERIGIRSSGRKEWIKGKDGHKIKWKKRVDIGKGWA